MTGADPAALFGEDLQSFLDEIHPRLVEAERSGRVSGDLSREILRRLHGLKGAARLVGRDRVARLLHALEGALRAGVDRPERVERFLDGLDLLGRIEESPVDRTEELIEALEAAGSTAIDLTERLREELPGIDPSIFGYLTSQQERTLAAAVDSGQSVLQVAVSFDRATFRRSSVEFRETIRSLGRPLAMTSGGHDADGRPRFLQVLVTARPSAEVERSLAIHQAEVIDGRDLGSETTEETSGAVDLLAPLREMYLASFSEKIDQVHLLIEALAQEPGDRERLDELFRFGHSLKGSAGTYGFAHLSRLAGAFEDALERVRNEERLVGPAESDLFLDWAGSLAEFRSAPEDDSVGTDVMDRLRAFAGGGSEALASPLAPTPSARLTMPLERRENVRVAVDRIDALVDMAGDLHLERRDLGLLDARFDGFQRSLRRVRRESEDERPDAARLLESFESRLTDLVEALHETVGRVDGRIERLTEAALGIRMTPIGTLFERLPRLVREVSRSLDREVRLEVEGGDTELDRSMIDELTDPLMHMIRNAVDHGIEPPAERLRLGKPTSGTLTLRASPSGSRIAIELTDDGAGFEASAIRGRAVEVGLVEADRIGSLTDDEVFRLVFEAGFTTRREVTEISGRGVGLDVVKNSISRLGGEILLESEAGRGTTIRIELPITVSLLPSLLVRDQGRLCALPGGLISGIRRVDPDEVLSAAGRPFLLVEGRRFPIVSLSSIVGPGGRGEPTARAAWLLADDGTHRAALEVDAVVCREDIVVKPLGAILRNVPHVIGVSVRPEGSLAVVLDPASLLLASRGAVRPSAERATSGPTHRVLVVDDLASSRAVVVASLEGEGYEVSTAADGEEAWDLLVAGSIDLVVSDVEMPRLDGCALIRRMRANEETAPIPVILLTSRGSDEEKREGLLAGADAYLVKSRFRSTELARLVAERLGREVLE